MRILLKGHAEGELWALAVHAKLNVFVTGSDDKTVRLWDATSRKLVCMAKLGQEIRSAAFSPDGQHVACGLKNGSFAVLAGKDLKEARHHLRNFHSVMFCTQISRTPCRKEVLHELKYSPDGAYLAVGSNDNFVDVFDVKAGYKKVKIDLLV